MKSKQSRCQSSTRSSSTTHSKPSRTTPSQQFRQLSATQSRSFSLKNSPPRPTQQSTHKIPNSVLSRAHENTSFKSVRRDLLGHAHSSSNIMYSSNNKAHSEMERNLSSNNYHSSSVRQKGGSIANSMKKLHSIQNSSATTHVMREMRHSGEGYNAVVASFDKRTFQNPSEKKQINIARRNLK
ncbi:hypothetical protein C9374_005373 [Naegleria lovaniensis]|uniref:Uncharacterized protein n=1 Tax=Naegleria lovaniensis TaxID=51637 RepID=A0AA88GJJ8_NAELO|nr:uncharacterized protein C9374_005373 [Naegleria lovaniensis]KAG2382171.1 hypothetical protein C9374_005373 [Naegleria lovaniensis]